MSHEQPFVDYLSRLAERDRGAMAALRRGLRRPPGQEPAMYPYVIPWLHDGLYPWTRDVHFIVASLFASHPQAGGGSRGNMGAHWHTLVQVKQVPERRFVALLRTGPDRLPTRLRENVNLLRANKVPVNWHQLYHDLIRWTHPARYIQSEWAIGFWGQSQIPNQSQSQGETE